MQSKRHATLLLCLVLAALVSSTLARVEVRKCVPDKSYFDGCNECKCLNGRRACTMMACDGPTIEAPSDFWEPIRDAPLPEP